MGPRKTASGYLAGMGQISGGEGSSSTGYSAQYLGPGGMARPRLLAGQRLQYVDSEISHFHYGIELWTSTPAAAGINILFPSPSSYFFSFPFPSLLWLPQDVRTHPRQPQFASNIIGIYYRVDKKIGEGAFGVIFEGPSPPSLTSTPES